MPEYLLYGVDFSGRIVGPSKQIKCADDREAAQIALLSASDCDVELWQGNRLVVRLPRYKKALEGNLL